MADEPKIDRTDPLSDALLRPDVKRGPGRPTVSQERRNLFLKYLEATGSWTYAASMASPHCVGAAPGVKTFRDLYRRDIPFQMACNVALETALGKLESTAIDRANTPDKVHVVWQKTGEVVAVNELWRSANQALFRCLAARDPARWAEKRAIQTDVTTHVGSKAPSTVFQLTPDDLRCLNADQMSTFLKLLDVIQDSRDNEPLAALPGPMDANDTNEDILDGAEIVKSEGAL